MAAKDDGQRRLPIVGQPEAPPERRDAARNRAKILATARTLLRDRPIRDICMDELARAAGVGKGTLYRRFEDRASLCRALLHDEAIALQDQVLNEFGLGPRTPWLARTARLLDALFDFHADNASLLSEAQAFDRGGPGRYEHPAHTWQRDTLARYLARAADAGEIPTADTPDLTAELILAGLDPDLLQYHLGRGVDREVLRARFTALWRGGVRTPPCRTSG